MNKLDKAITNLVMNDKAVYIGMALFVLVIGENVSRGM